MIENGGKGSGCIFCEATHALDQCPKIKALLMELEKTQPQTEEETVKIAAKHGFRFGVGGRLEKK